LSRAQAESLRDLFAEFRPALLAKPLADFSGLRAGAPLACEIAPRTAGTAARLVRAAHERDIPLRTRAQGHSLNGSSLPRAGELLLATRNIGHVRFEEPGTVTAGSGVVLWILQYFLRRRGFDLPVLNDGYAGPSVGGYIAAGGFGPRSGVHGGFWDNVLEIRLIDGRGELASMNAHDARFPWLFGSMGQLGIFFDAKLAIVPLNASGPPPPYPAGEAFTAPQLAQPKVPPEFTMRDDESLFWFTLFVPDEHLELAHDDVTGLERRHVGALRFQERYRYPILQRGRVAPLVYPEARAFTATGAWGWLRDKSAAGTRKLLEFDAEFMALAQSRPYYRRYVQSELPSGADIYERCFGAETYARFRQLKSELDPRGLLNRGTVFPAP
jgi:FAD/FMN-containing dehydrogenase